MHLTPREQEKLLVVVAADLARRRQARGLGSTTRRRGERPFVFTDLKSGAGAPEVVRWLRQQLDTPAAERRPIIDAHAPRAPHAHTHHHPH